MLSSYLSIYRTHYYYVRTYKKGRFFHFKVQDQDQDKKQEKNQEVENIITNLSTKSNRVFAQLWKIP